MTPLLAMALPCAAVAEETYEFDRWCVGAGGGIALPGNGCAFRRAASAHLRGAYYATETFALEAEGFSVPRAAMRGGGASVTGAAFGALAHFTSLTFYDRLFGSERLDPFLAFGAQASFASRHAFADRSHRAAIGPYLGLGAFYHLTDRLSIRAEARASLLCDSPCGMAYGVQAGLQYSFGADE